MGGGSRRFEKGHSFSSKSFFLDGEWFNYTNQCCLSENQTTLIEKQNLHDYLKIKEREDFRQIDFMNKDTDMILKMAGGGGKTWGKHALYNQGPGSGLDWADGGDLEASSFQCFLNV